ncbi:UNVERIFIED_CONTAM: hypothetical protein Sangu_0426500, partial [Sesamum angustifolium]
MASVFSKDFFAGISFWKTLLAVGLVLYLILIPISNIGNPQLFLIKWASSSSPSQPVSGFSRTNLSHIAFGLLGSVKTWPHRRGYLEAWWRPNKTRGYVYLDRPPTPDLLPWPQTAPPYRIVDNISEIFRSVKPRFELMPRMVHGILELFREEHDDMRWIVMGDDDSIFFVDNIVDVLAEYDHTKYVHYIRERTWFSSEFGGGGIVLSYPLAKALVKDMDGCLVRYAQSSSADLITMTCIADIGVNLTPHKGIHQ